MEFLNESVNVDQLPKVEDVPLKPVEPVYLKVLRIEWLITTLAGFFIAGILLFFIDSLRRPPWVTILFGGWCLLTALYYFLQKKSFDSLAYAIREHDVIYRSGWIIQSVRTCPYNRIQHSTVSTGPLDRKFGLATLVFYSAGTDDADLRISGLKEEDAYSLKEWVTKKIVNEEPA